jgi:hypothetical protein
VHHRADRLVAQRLGPHLDGQPHDAVGAHVRLDEVDRDAHRVGEGVAGIGRRLGERLADHARVPVHDRRDDLVLAAEVPVDRAHGQVGLGDHVLHRGGVEAVAQEAGAGGVEDLLAAGREVGFGDAGHAPKLKRTLVLDNSPDPGRRCSIKNDHSF